MIGGEGGDRGDVPRGKEGDDDGDVSQYGLQQGGVSALPRVDLEGGEGTGEEDDEDEIGDVLPADESADHDLGPSAER